MAWVRSRKKSYVAGLFDEDLDAKKAKKELDGFLNGRHGAKTFCLGKCKPKPTHLQHLFQVFQKEISIPIALEEIYSPSIWEYADQQGWLEQRDFHNELNTINKSFEEFEKYCKNKGLTQEEQRYVLKKLKKYKKENLVNYILGLEPDELMKALNGFESLVKALSEFFKKNL